MRWLLALLLPGLAACGVKSEEVLIRLDASAGTGSATARPDAGTLPDGETPTAFELEVLGDTVTTLGVPFELELVALGAETPLEWSVVFGELPAGVELEAGDGPIARILGTAVATGRHVVTIEAADTSGAQARAGLDLRVTDGIVIVTTALPPATVGVPFAATLEAAGGHGTHTWSAFGGPLPAGLQVIGLADGRSAIAGTPRDRGIYTVDIAVSDEHGARFVRSFVLDVAAPLTVATTLVTAGTLGRPYEHAVRATGGTPPYRWSARASSLPPGIALAEEGTPSTVLFGIAGASGSFGAVVEVVDDLGRTATGTVVLDVADSGVRLAIERDVPPAPTACAPLRMSFTAIGGGQVGHVWTAAFPPGLSVDPSSGGTLRVEGFVSQPGVYGPITVRVADAAGEEAMMDVELDVAPARRGGRWAALATRDVMTNAASFELLDLCRTTPVAGALAMPGVSLTTAAFSAAGDRFVGRLGGASTSTITTLRVYDLEGDAPSIDTVVVDRRFAPGPLQLAGSSRVLFLADAPFEVLPELLPGVFRDRTQVFAAALDEPIAASVHLAPMPRHQEISSVSPDGRWVVVEDDERELWLVDLEDQAPAPRLLECLASNGAATPWSAWAPGGEVLVYRCRQSALAWVSPTANGIESAATPLPGIGTVRAPSRAGGRWLWAEGPDTVTLIDLDPAHLGRTEVLALGQGFEVSGVAFAEDDRWIGIGGIEASGSRASFYAALPPPGIPLASPPVLHGIGTRSPRAVQFTFTANSRVLVWTQDLALAALRLDGGAGPFEIGTPPSCCLSSRVHSLPGTDHFLVEDELAGTDRLRLIDLESTPADVWAATNADFHWYDEWGRAGGAGFFYASRPSALPTRLYHVRLLGPGTPAAADVLPPGRQLLDLRLPPRAIE